MQFLKLNPSPVSLNVHQQYGRHLDMFNTGFQKISMMYEVLKEMVSVAGTRKEI